MSKGLLGFRDLEIGEVDQRRVFGLRQDRVKKNSDNSEMLVDRLLVPDWVNIIAFTEDDELLVVRQFRFGVSAFTLEIPAGVVDPGEAPRDAALRELREETGFVPADGHEVIALGSARPNPAFMNNRVHSFHAPRVILAGAPEPDENEELELVKVPRADVREMLRSGQMDSALALVAFFRLELR